MITAHILVKNEEQWIWYSIMSVIGYVDEILVWDTGSTDRTVEIIKSITSPKIKFRQYGEVDALKFNTARNDMLNNTSPGWMIIVDGDEIWPRSAIKNLTDAIRNDGDRYDYFISRYHNLLGDIYHHQEELAGRYQIGKYLGHITIRAVNLDRIPGIHFDKPHGQEGLFDKDNQLIQLRPPSNSKLLPGAYFHTTHLVRSVNHQHDNQVIKRKQKFKYELGITFPENFSFPEVFYLPTPPLVSNPWRNRSLGYFLNSLWQTPLKLVKRRLIKNQSSGY